MTSALSPSYAANLASDVYGVKLTATRGIFIDKYSSDMELSQDSFSPGVTGGYIVKKRHVMAVFSSGKGAYKGQAFIAFKGTASLYDAITDLNTGVKTSHTGLPVHQGFYYAFDSLITELRQFVGELKGVSTIHCIGHSLGGAIATLAADWIKSSGHAAVVKLYTFGSPRVGLGRFAKKCTSRVLAENTYRVYHKTDPIPMVPTWPFAHVPSFGGDYLIHSPVSMPPWKYHFMEHYIKSVEGSSGWKSIENNRPQSYGQITLENWLKSDGIVSFSANSLQLLDAALVYVLEKVAHAVSIAINGIIATGLTLLDRLAMILAEAASISADLSVWVYYLVRKMAALVGVTIKKGTSLTVEFIRAIFIHLHQRVSDMVMRIGRHIG